MPAALTFEQQVRRDAERLVDQGEFDFLMPFSAARTLLKPHEAALCMARSLPFIYAELERGDSALEAVKLPGRERAELRITRRSVLLWLALAALEASTDTRIFAERVDFLIDGISSHALLDRIIRRATARKGKL
jgi:hypothetical protein